MLCSGFYCIFVYLFATCQTFFCELKFSYFFCKFKKKKKNLDMLLLLCRRGHNRHCVHIVALSEVGKRKPRFLKIMCPRLISFNLLSKKRFLSVYTMYETLFSSNLLIVFDSLPYNMYVIHYIFIAGCISLHS